MIVIILLHNYPLVARINNYQIDLNDPVQISRLKGLVKYKILSSIITYSDDNLNGIPDKQEEEQERYKRKLISKRKNNKLINPWSKIIEDNLSLDSTFLMNNFL